MIVSLISLFINIAIGGLLVAVIVYCKRLNANIKILQDSRNEMAQLFSEFDASISKASNSVRELQDAAALADSIFKDKLEKANLLADDLAFMIDRGNKLADQLETGLKESRSAVSKEIPLTLGANMKLPDAVSSATPPPTNKLGPFADKSLNRPKPAPEKTTPAAKSAASIEAVLEQMANRNNPANALPGSERKPNTRIRSKAEQELFDSLKSGR